MSAVSYTPAPYEQAYYEGLFQAADVKRAGSIGGAEAVAFFSRSKLPTDMLKNVWTVADQNPQTNSLDRRKFFTAVRLIQLSQNGQKAQGSNLAAPPGVTLRPVMFDGVSGVSVPMPQQQGAPPPQQQQAPPQQQQQPPPPQQMQQPPPQQMQQPPPMQQQMQMQAPPSPQRPVPPRPAPPQQQQSTMSMALTTQDPYSLPPQEQARYEDIFPQHAKPDGYVYGAEAVALFSKSGLSQQILRDIWNMVDTPVDNRLDKLEFAIAMHLIVCVSKKNLPMPPGLPISLKSLKSQQAQQQQAPPPLPAMGAAPAAPQMGMPPPAAAPQMGMPPPAAAPQMGMPPPAVAAPQMGSSMSVGSGGAPPIQSTPPAEIHAPPALQPTGGAMAIHDAFEGLGSGSGTGLASSSFPEPGSFASNSSFDQTPHVETIPEPVVETVREPAPVVMEKPKTTKELASSYDMGDNHAELEKLKGMLQKLQAENISLKASLGSMTEEEREVQKEIGATVAEIGKLSSELTTLRAQVLAAKSALLEATAELKGHHEKKEMIADLISETQATKDAIHAALDGVHEAEKITEEEEAKAHRPAPSYEADLFGFGDAAPAPAPPAEQPEPVTKSIPEPAPPAMQQPNSAAAVHPNPAPAPVITTVSSEDEDQGLQPGSYAQLASAGQVMTVNSSFDEDGAMGGPASLSPAPFSGESPALPHKTFEPAAAVGASSPTAADVEKLKESARQADQTAHEAEATRQSLSQQADDLRKIADQAEQEARDKEAAVAKKKGGFGRKKKEMREVEKAKQDAAEKRRQFMDVLTQANNAQALALETRREADRISHQAEQAEVEAVQAVSMQQTQPPAFHVPAAPIAAPAPAPTNGGMHEKQPSYGGFGGGFGIMGGAVGDGGGFSIPSPSGSVHGDANPF